MHPQPANPTGQPDRPTPPEWESVGVDNGPALALREEYLALKDAVRQVARVGTPAQHTAAAAALTTARKELYRLLAQDAAEPEA